MRTIKFEIAYKKFKGDEWNIISIWGRFWSEIKGEFRKKIGKSFEEIYNYAILKP